MSSSSSAESGNSLNQELPAQPALTPAAQPAGMGKEYRTCWPVASIGVNGSASFALPFLDVSYQLGSSVSSSKRRSLAFSERWWLQGMCLLRLLLQGDLRFRRVGHKREPTVEVHSIVPHGPLADRRTSGGQGDIQSSKSMFR